MGLDTSHGCFHGAYSAFSRFRVAIAKTIGMDFDAMDGIAEGKGLSWEPYRDEPLGILLCRGDCDGQIEAKDCAPLAKRLREIAPKLQGVDGGGHLGKDMSLKVIQFAEGLELAASLGEPVAFS